MPRRQVNIRFDEEEWLLLNDSAKFVGITATEMARSIVLSVLDAGFTTYRENGERVDICGTEDCAGHG